MNELKIESYIAKIADNCECNYAEVEEIVLTQLALILGDLAVKKESTMLIGKLTLNDNETFTVLPNDFIIDILKGKIDPLILLNEIMKNT